MRNLKAISALLILLVLPGLAGAGTLENVNGMADCTSWAADLTISFRANAMMARVEYAVVLLNADGTEVERFDFADFIDIPDAPTAVYHYGGDWSTALDGNYTVTGDVTVYDIFGDGNNVTTGSFSVGLACGSAVDVDPLAGEPCVHNPRYWARHLDAWPVDALDIAGANYDQNALYDMLTTLRGRFIYFHLTRQLIAAKLNLANGANQRIAPTVLRADAFLSRPHVGHRARARSRNEGLKLAIQLYLYNQSRCRGRGRVEAASAEEFAKMLEQGAPEAVSLGSLKASYR